VIVETFAAPTLVIVALDRQPQQNPAFPAARFQWAISFSYSSIWLNTSLISCAHPLVPGNHTECLSAYLARQSVKPVFFLTSLNDFCQLFCQPRTQLLQRGEIGLRITFATISM
jgi:hypothetical protein